MMTKWVREIEEHLQHSGSWVHKMSNLKSAYSADNRVIRKKISVLLHPFSSPIKLNQCEQWAMQYVYTRVSTESTRYFSLPPTVLFGANCWGRLPGQQCEWLTHSCQQTAASSAPPPPTIPKHSHSGSSTSCHKPGSEKPCPKDSVYGESQGVSSAQYVIYMVRETRRGERSRGGVGVGQSPKCQGK